MARVRSKRTGPEQRVAAALRGLGVHYRRNVAALPGTPDFANRKRGWAILVHGCFWHQHACKRAVRPVHNADWWAAKLDRNMARDLAVEHALTARGLRVLTLWECELKTGDLQARLGAFLGVEGPAGQRRCYRSREELALSGSRQAQATGDARADPSRDGLG